MAKLRALALCILAPLMEGCAAAAPQPDSPSSPLGAAEVYARAFEFAEPAVLAEIGHADARFALRLGVRPDAAFDPFAIGARIEQLRRIASDLGDMELPQDSPLRGAPALAPHLLEASLLARLLETEEARALHEENAGPRATGDLVRALSDTWPDHTSAGVDATMAFRLDQVRASIRSGSLSELDRDDALAAVDRLAARTHKLPRTSAALRRLRAAIVAIVVAPLALEDWDDLAPMMRALVGVVPEVEALDATLLAREAELRAVVEVGLSVLAPEYRDAVRRRAAAELAGEVRCPRAAAPSAVRALAPPPERARLCTMVAGLASADDDLGEVASLMALHDGVVAAGWALALHGRVRDPGAARARFGAPLTASDDGAALLRLAAIRPADAINIGLAADLLLRSGTARVRARARAWRAFGDAPLDVVEAALLLT